MKNLIYLLLILLSFGVSFAQENLTKEEKERREENIKSGNPFAQFGYKAKIATLSKGKYLEFHDLDSIVTIGTVRFNVHKNLIVGTFEQDTLNPDSQPMGDRAGRWISPDPLSEEFTEWSPYNYSFNSPIQFNDPTGLSPENTVDDSRGQASTYVDSKGKIIKHIDDDDTNIYLVNDTSKWDGTKKGLTVIGQERSDKSYKIGDILDTNDLFGNVKLPYGFRFNYAKFGFGLDDLNPENHFEVSPLLGGFYKKGLSYVVYFARGSKGIQYVGMTSQFAIRYATHLRSKGIYIEKALEGLSKADAKAVEQVLIELYKLEKNGGTLINKINSISKSNPVYKESIERGVQILQEAGIKF